MTLQRLTLWFLPSIRPKTGTVFLCHSRSDALLQALQVVANSSGVGLVYSRFQIRDVSKFSS